MKIFKTAAGWNRPTMLRIIAVDAYEVSAHGSGSGASTLKT